MSHKTGTLRYLLFLVCSFMAASCETGDSDALFNGTVVVETQTNGNTQGQSLPSDSFLCIDEDCSIGIFTSTATRDEAKILLEERYGPDSVNIDNETIEWHTSSGSGYLQISEENEVTEARFTLQEEHLRMENLINQLGEPSLVHVTAAFSPGYLCAGSRVLYSKYHISSVLYPENGTVGIVPNQFIYDFWYYEGLEDIIPTDTWVVEWQGFLDYCELVANLTAMP